MDNQHVENQGVVITAPERLDYSVQLNLPEFDDNIPEQDMNITIDLQNTTEIDSSGIGALLLLQNLVPETAPKVRLVNCNQGVIKALNICHMHHIFNIIRDEPDEHTPVKH